MGVDRIGDSDRASEGQAAGVYGKCFTRQGQEPRMGCGDKE